MTSRLQRSIDEPVHEDLSLSERWEGPDKGLVWCWELGRRLRVEEPELAARAEQGELVVLAWRGGVSKKLAFEKKAGTLKYLATWQGLRGADLDIWLDGECTLVCTVTGQAVVFSAAAIPPDEE